MKHIIIGTAGHVDHGKTALVKALTGVDTDRLLEEKKRGISIDLGFASLKIGEFLTAGIVDVPGHERFLKNMLAGTGAIDLALLVIAADESVMPQTREHLDMLDLLGVKQGIIVINKIDKVDTDWLELIEEEITALTGATFLKNAPLCRVSALSGAGLENLKETILAVAAKIPERNETAPFRLWIDRVFSAKGHGAVVTGSILSGTVKVGDTLAVYPAGQLVRVRALETHAAKAGVLKAGQRAAINLSGPDDLARGMSLSTPERGEVHKIWEVKIDWRQEVKSAARVRLHLGTAEVLGRVYKYKDQTSDHMRLILEKPLAAATGDKAILRLYSPQTLLGAATFLASGSLSRKFNASRLLIGTALAQQTADLAAIITGRLTGEKELQTMKDIARLSGYWPEAALLETVKKMTQAGILIKLENGCLLKSEATALGQKAQNILKEFHAQNSQAGGLGKEILRQRLKLEEKTFENLLSFWQKEWPDEFVLTGGGTQIAQKSHAAKFDAQQQDVVQKSQPFLTNIGFENIDLVFLGNQLGLEPKEARNAQEIPLKTGNLVKMGTIFLAGATITRTLLLLQNHFAQNTSLNISEFKDLIGVSRKIAVPFLEYLDTQKYTRRSGDTRQAMPKLLNFTPEGPHAK
ncbi:MAG: selenocysteine-specific translation elongation factor [Sporomusaceae bacterium]|jgi:selenocysteine-specific elongation factor|nr:selenocysteine-specific translation elongation factor [Sporomusaceae bacterium]